MFLTGEKRWLRQCEMKKCGWIKYEAVCRQGFRSKTFVIQPTMGFIIKRENIESWFGKRKHLPLKKLVIKMSLKGRAILATSKKKERPFLKLVPVNARTERPFLEETPIRGRKKIPFSEVTSMSLRMQWTVFKVLLIKSSKEIHRLKLTLRGANMENSVWKVKPMSSENNRHFLRVIPITTENPFLKVASLSALSRNCS